MIWHVLLAAQNPFEAVSRYLNRSGPRVEVRYLLLVTGSLAALALLLMALERVRQWRERTAQTPKSLFNDLCGAHSLSRAERRVLSRAASVFPPAAECRVFVDPRPLENLARAGGSDGAISARLLQRLF